MRQMSALQSLGEGSVAVIVNTVASSLQAERMRVAQKKGGQDNPGSWLRQLEVPRPGKYTVHHLAETAARWGHGLRTERIYHQTNSLRIRCSCLRRCDAQYGAAIYAHCLCLHTPFLTSWSGIAPPKNALVEKNESILLF